MGDPANQLNVPSNAPTEAYRTPDQDPQFDTTSKDETFGARGQPVNSPSTNVQFGGVGAPVSNGE